MLTHITQAFLLGLSVGPACLGFCAPVCVPYLAVEEQRGLGRTARLLGVFLLGRLAGYSVVGVVAGLVGTLLLRETGAAFWGVVRMAMGLLLIAYGLASGTSRHKWCPWPAGTARSLWVGASLGLLTGLNLCPPFGAAIAGAASTASVHSAVLYFWAFFAGTALFFFPLLIISPFSRMEPFRQVARICLFLAGAWLALEGVLVFL